MATASYWRGVVDRLPWAIGVALVYLGILWWLTDPEQAIIGALVCAGAMALMPEPWPTAQNGRTRGRQKRSAQDPRRT